MLSNRFLLFLFLISSIPPVDVEKLYAAARRTLEWKRNSDGGHTSWSAAWEACLWARLGAVYTAYYGYCGCYGYCCACIRAFSLPPTLSYFSSSFVSIFIPCSSPPLFLYFSHPLLFSSTLCSSLYSSPPLLPCSYTPPMLHPASPLSSSAVCC